MLIDSNKSIIIIVYEIISTKDLSVKICTTNKKFVVLLMKFIKKTH